MSPRRKASSTRKKGGTTRKRSSPARGKTPIKVFISYSHRDSRFRDELMDMLSILIRQKVIDVWHDREIAAGASWYRAIRSAMNKSDMAILLVSQYFLNSEFIQREEVPVLLKQRKGQGMRVIPIIVRDCLWEDDPVISKIQVLPREGRPIQTFPIANGHRNKVWKEVAQSIRRRAKNLQQKR